MREDGHALVLMIRTVRATLRVSTRGIGDLTVRETGRRSPSPILRLTLELVTVGDFALPVAGLFVQVKGQSAGTRDLLQAGPCTPAGAGT